MVTRHTHEQATSSRRPTRRLCSRVRAWEWTLIVTTACATLGACGSERDADRKLKNPPQARPSPETSKNDFGDARARKAVKVGIPSTFPGQPGTCVGPMGLERLLDPASPSVPQTFLVGRLDESCYDRTKFVIRLNVSTGVRLSAAIVCARLSNSIFNFECHAQTSDFLVDGAIVIPIGLSYQAAANLKVELELPSPANAAL